MRNLITYISILITLVFTLNVNAQYENIDDLPKHIEKGRVRLKLKQEVFQQNSSFKSVDIANTNSTETGVSSIDEVGEQIRISRISRVFPFSLKDESKHRKYGLHLWLEVEFDSQVDALYAVDLYSELAEVDIAKPVFKKIRHDGDKKPIKYKAGDLKVIKEAPASTLKNANTEFDAPNDPLFPNQWHYETDLEKYENGRDIEMLKAWSITSGDSNVIVAIVDGGIDVNHEDLADNIWVNHAEMNGEDNVDDDQNGYIDDYHGYNFVFPGEITPHEHGTHVAGTVGASTNNGKGVAGVAGGGTTINDTTLNGVRMISCQVFDNRTASSGNFAAAIVYGADNGAVISQNSWGYTVPNYYEPEVLDAIRYFIAEAGQYEGSPMKGGILFFAAGNDGLEQTHYPATFEEVVAVTALGPEGYPAGYTNTGEWTDIAAPGGDQAFYEHEGGVLSTLPFDEYGYFQGTSMACPHVSGVAALILTKYANEGLTPDDLRNRIVNSTSRFVFEHNNKYGTGMLNAPNALANDEKIPPEAIDDLVADEIYHNEVRLQWTIPVDEDNFQPKYIYLALSGSEITASNFDIKPQLIFENPYDAGTEVQVNIGGLIKQTDYWFAIKTQDQFGNISEISNILAITTTDEPKFTLSDDSIYVNIDVTEKPTFTKVLQLGNVGEGIVYWENYVENERFYFEVEESLKDTIEAKANYAAANPHLFEVNENPDNQVSLLKSGSIETQNSDYWDYDETIFVAGMSYENGNPAVNLMSSLNPNAGLISATRFDIAADYTFNLTHLEVAMYNNVNDKPIIVEIKKGSKYVEESETVYLQEYYSDTTEVFGFQRISLYRPQRFQDGEIFWIVLHFPKEDLSPLGVAFDTWYPNMFLISRDNGRTFMDYQQWWAKPNIPLVRALSTGDDGAYVFLKPGKGEIEADVNQSVDLHIDANALSEGRHLASVTLLTNDINKPYVSIEVNVNVQGQNPEIDTNKVHSFNVFQSIDNELNLKISNTGLAHLEVYDIRSNDTGFVKNFNDTITLYLDFATEIPFKYTPSHLGTLESEIELVTNYGTFGVPVHMNSSEPAVMDATISNNVLNLAYGEKGSLTLNIANNSASSKLNYDLSRYKMLNKVRSVMSEPFNYSILTSEDNNGPIEGTWEDISEIGASYDALFYWRDTIEMDMKFPYFDEVTKTIYHGAEGTLYFYDTWENGVQLPAEDIRNIGKGVFAPMLFSDSSVYFPLTEMIHYSFGDREVFTISVNERITGKPNAVTDTMTYQVVLFRDGTIEYRYKDVSALTSEMSYVVAIQGFRKEDYAVYRNLNQHDVQIYDGLVIRFVPDKDPSMVLETTPANGLISNGESTNVEISIDPSMYNVYAGTYNNQVILNTNTLEGEVSIPFQVTISGAASFMAADSVLFDRTNVGDKNIQLLKLANTGSDIGQITKIVSDNTNFSVAETLPLTVQPSAHILLPLAFAPANAGLSKANLTITYSNGTTETVYVEGTSQINPNFTHTIPSNIVVNVTGGETASVPFNFSVDGSGGDLEYAFLNSTLASVSSANVNKASDNNTIAINNLYGYTWITDSLNISYKWESIENDAEILYIKTGKQKGIKLPFEFPFYGSYYDSIFISKNGYVTVVEPEGEPFSLTFEKEDGLAGMIAPFWTPLVPNIDGEGVWLKTEDERVLVEWNNFRGEEGSMSGGNVTFQLEITADGSIYFHYKDISYFEGVLQYGLESPDEQEELNKPKTWILPWTDLENERSIVISPPLKSTILSGNNSDFSLDVDGSRIFKTGQYFDTIKVYTTSYLQAQINIPVTINASGSPELNSTEELSWDNIIYQAGKKIRGTIHLGNTGNDVAEISRVTFDGLEDLTLYDEEGDEILKNSTGKLISPISVKPWYNAQFDVEFTINTFADVSAKIYLEGNFSTSQVNISVKVVDSPEFDWTATNQEFNLNESEDGSYSFEIENKGQTTLAYELVPAVVPSGNNNNGSGIIEEIGNYTFEMPNTVDSLNIEDKNEADGVFTPMVGGAILSFCNEFVAPEGGFFLTHVKAWTYLKKLDEYVTVMVYVGGDEPQGGEKVYEQNFIIDEQSDGQWVIYPLQKPVQIPEGETFYVMVTPPVDRSFIGYDINTDQKVQEKTYVGVYWLDGEFKWHPTQSEDWDNSIYKIRPLTAAGKGQWLELDHYSGEALSGEKVNVTATFSGSTAGPGEHKAKLIVKSNDINNSSSQVDLAVNINGAPDIIYRPNLSKDTLTMTELDELVLNYLATDPEGDEIIYSLVTENEGADVSFVQLDNNSAQMTISTGYNDSGFYKWIVNINDAAGNVTSDSIMLNVVDKNRAPYMNPKFATITLNSADPNEVFTIDANELFIDPDGDPVNILAGNYTPDVVDLSLGTKYIDIHPLQQGTGYLVFAGDDGKENGFVVYEVFVFVINDPAAVNASPDGFTEEEKANLTADKDLAVFPNPIANGEANFIYKIEEEASVTIEVYDLTGVKCFSYQKSQEEGIYGTKIDVSKLEAGPYFCRFIVGNEIKKTIKLVVN